MFVGDRDRELVAAGGGPSLLQGQGTGGLLGQKDAQTDRQIQGRSHKEILTITNAVSAVAFKIKSKYFFQDIISMILAVRHGWMDIT